MKNTLRTSSLCLFLILFLGATALAYSPPAFPEDIEVFMTPDSGPPCTAVNITGFDLFYQEFGIYLHNAENEVVGELARGELDESGKIDFTFNVPSDLQPGNYVVRVAVWTDPCRDAGPDGDCPTDAPGAYKSFPFKVIEAGVGAAAYCSAGNSLSETTGQTATEDTNGTEAARANLPETGIGKIWLAVAL